jgi:hypothetical protein
MNIVDKSLRRLSSWWLKAVLVALMLRYPTRGLTTT